MIYVPIYSLFFVVTHVRVCVHVHAFGIAEELAFIPNRSINVVSHANLN